MTQPCTTRLVNDCQVVTPIRRSLIYCVWARKNLLLNRNLLAILTSEKSTRQVYNLFQDLWYKFLFFRDLKRRLVNLTESR